MKLNLPFFALLLSASFGAQAQNAATTTNVASGNLKIAAAGTQTTELTYRVTSDASEDIKLDMSTLKKESRVGLHARVLDHAGKEVLNAPNIEVSGHLVKVLNTSDLPPGSYVIELSGAKKADVIQRVAFVKGPGGILITETN